jgi:hypothetical protein
VFCCPGYYKHKAAEWIDEIRAQSTCSKCALFYVLHGILSFACFGPVSCHVAANIMLLQFQYIVSVVATSSSLVTAGG